MTPVSFRPVGDRPVPVHDATRVLDHGSFSGGFPP